MNMQFIGLVLLVAILSVGIYVSTHYSDLSGFRIKLPIKIEPFESAPVSTKRTAPNSNLDLSLFPAETGKTVRISNVKKPTSDEPYWEIILAANLSSNKELDITGWVLKTDSGSFTIPKAQEVYSFGGQQGNIVLRSGAQVHFFSGRALKGNFRLNKCMGYIEKQSPFIPSLPKECPYINRSDISRLSGACQEYISSLRVCEIPSANPSVPSDDSACHDFLKNLNYDGCAEKHRQDYDFLSGSWMIWMDDQGNIFSPDHDRVQIVDRQKKMIDEYIY